MTLVDLVVLAVVALAALRGRRRGGTGLVLRVAAADRSSVLGSASERLPSPTGLLPPTTTQALDAGSVR